MSDLSDAVFGTPAPTPRASKPQPSAAPKPAPKTNPLIGKGLGPSLMDRLTGGQGSAVAGKVMNVLDTPFTLAGAYVQDKEAHRPQYDERGRAMPDTALQHAIDLMKKGQFGKAAEAYSLVNLNATKRRAQMGEPLARLAVQHPTAFGLGALGAEFLNPLSIGVGRVAELGGAGARAGLAGAARAAEQAGAKGAARTARTASQGAFNRYAEVQGAAAREAERRGANPQQAAAQANQAARMMTQAPGYGRGMAQRLVKNIFKGLNTQDQYDLVHFIEGEKTIGVPGSKTFQAATPKERMLYERAQQYRAIMKDLDKQQVAAGLDPARLWQSETYFPRKGFAMDPNASLDEDVQEMLGGGGRGVGYRAGTAGANVHRTYRSLKDAVRKGVVINPEWKPSVALENHLAQRFQNIRLNQGLQQLDALGLMEDLGKRPDYAPFTETSQRTFGSPVTRPKAVDPSIVRLLDDMQPPTKTGGVASVVGKIPATLRKANQIAARFEVGNPLFHPIVNLRPNYYAAGGTTKDLLSELIFGKTVRAAEQEGAVLPYASEMPMGEQVLPFSERSAEGKLQSLGQPIEAITSKPLYGWMEPRIGAALYRSLRNKGMSEAEAVAKVRAALGEPENLAGSERGVAESFMFPSWMKSQARFWSKQLATRPQGYVAAHRGVEARNRSRGMSPQGQDYYSYIPGIAGYKTKGGGEFMYEVPHPANRILGLLGLAADKATGTVDEAKTARALTNLLNPLLATAGREIATANLPATSPQYGTVLYDKDAPANVKAMQHLESVLGRFAPVRPESTGPAQLLGLSGYTRTAGTAQSKAESAVDRMVRPIVEKLRNGAVKLRKAGKVEQANALDALADRYWQAMNKVETRLGTP